MIQTEEELTAEAEEIVRLVSVRSLSKDKVERHKLAVEIKSRMDILIPKLTEFYATDGWNLKRRFRILKLKAVARMF